jgi:hypothetical protein
MRGVGIAALVAVAVGAAAGGAWAFDATGVWRGSLRCSGQVLSDRRSFARDGVELRISGDTLHVESRVYRAAFLPDGRNPNRGAMVLIGCSTALSPDFRGQMGRLKIVTKPGSATGTISGEVLTIGDSIAESFFVCKWKFRRVSTVDPGVTPCG